MGACKKCGLNVMSGVNGFAGPQCMCWATPASTGPTLDVTGTLMQQSAVIDQLRADLAASQAECERLRADAEALRAAVRLGLCVNCYTSSDCIADGSAAVEIYSPEIADSIYIDAATDPCASARSAIFAAANQIDAARAGKGE